MILDIQIKNYRSFKDRCNFTMVATSTETKSNNVFVAPVSENDKERLLKIAIIYGANASGKTNIIRLLYALRSMISNMTADQGGEGDTRIRDRQPFIVRQHLHRLFPVRLSGFRSQGGQCRGGDQ